MRHLKKYESFDTYYPDIFYSKNTILDKNTVNKIDNEIEAIISDMSDYDISKLELELLDFADKNNCTLDNMLDTIYLKKIIDGKINIKESMSEYQINSWKRIFTILGIGGVLSGIILIVIGAVSSNIELVKIGIIVQTISKVVLILRNMGKLL